MALCLTIFGKLWNNNMSYTAVVFYNDVLENRNCEDFIKILRQLLKPELVNQCSMQALELADKNIRKTESSPVQDKTFSIAALKNRKVFIDTAKEDRDVADKFKARLNDHNIETTSLHPQPNNPSATFQDLKNALKYCDIVVMFYDKSPLSWLKARLRYYQVMQILRNAPMKHIFICSSQSQLLDKLPKNAVWVTHKECIEEDLK